MAYRSSKQGRGTVASVADYGIPAATSVTVAASNPYRQRIDIYVSGGTQVCYAYNAVATSTQNSFLLGPASYVSELTYTGPITVAIPSAAASSSVRVREISS